MADVIPQNVVQVDDRTGNHYMIFSVRHVTGTATDIIVDNSVVSAAELNDDLSSATGLNKETSASAGISILADDSATDGYREITIASGVATGTYIIVARFVGSGAGFGSSKVDN